MLKKYLVYDMQCVKEVKEFYMDPKCKNKKDLFYRSKKFRKNLVKYIKNPIEKENKMAESENLKDLMFEEHVQEKEDKDGRTYQEYYYDPISYWAIEKKRLRKGRVFEKDRLPFFDYERLDFIPLMSEISVSKLMKTIHPVDHKPIIPRSQKQTIMVYGEKETVPYLTKKDLVRIKNFICQKYDVLNERHIKYRQSIIDRIQYRSQEEFYFPENLHTEDFVLYWIRFGTEITPMASTYIYVEETKEKFCHHLFYDFLYVYPNKLPQGKCYLRFTSGLETTTKKLIKAWIGANFNFSIFSNDDKEYREQEEKRKRDEEEAQCLNS